MSLATSNRDGGRTNEAGHLRGVTKGFLGRVLSGLNVSQRGAGANMSVDVAIGDAIIQRSDGTYGHPAWNDAVYNQAIAAADGSNPRRDIVVMYIDYNETPSTGVANNTNGVVKITSVSGTAAGSPVDPSNATIQSAVGSGNPFIKLARVRVAAGATSISNSVIDDLRELATGMSQGGWIYDSVFTWVYASSTTFTIAGVDARHQFPVGTKIRLSQAGTVKYFAVTASSFSTNTTVTLDGGGTYTLTNTPIDTPSFSYSSRPQGYPYSVISNPQEWMQEIGRTELTGNATSITVSFPAKRFLRIITNVNPASATSLVMTFNGDTANNYAYNRSNNGATDVATVSNGNILIGRGSSWTTKQITDMFIHNPSGMLKLYRSISVNEETAGAANTATGTDQRGKYQSNNQITSVTITGSSNALAAGSMVVVLGHD